MMMWVNSVLVSSKLRDADLGCRNGVSQNVVSLLEPSAQYLVALKQDWYLH
jgi:hypothetical protein